MSEIKCSKCGDDAFKAGDRGAYLKRVSPMGAEFIGECFPSCRYSGTNEDAIISALEPPKE